MKRRLVCLGFVFLLVFLSGCTCLNMNPPSIHDDNYVINKTRFKTLYLKDDVLHVIISNNNDEKKTKSKIYDISEKQNQNIIAWIENSILYVKAVNNCDIVAPENMNDFFSENSNILSITIENMDTGFSTTMSKVFMNCKNLKKIVLSWNMYKVTDISYMFANCYQLKEFKIELKSAYQIKDASYMYQNCKQLKKYTDSNINMYTVETVEGMFQGCEQLELFSISSRTANLKNSSFMFQDCLNLEDVNLSTFYTSNLTEAQYMFNNCQLINMIDISSFDTSMLKNTDYMFANCTQLNTILVSSGWNTEKIQTSTNMFYASYNLPFYDSDITDKTNAHVGDGGYLSH